MKDLQSTGLTTFAIFRAAFQKTVPVMFGYVPIGIAFGFLLTQAGFHWLYAVLMSVVIYSGATQFLAIGFFVNHAAMIEIAITTLLLNLRHSFFGLSLIRKFSGIPRVKPYLIFALTDETYALLTALEEPEQQLKSRYYLFISFLNHLYWISGSLTGALLGQAIKTDLKGMDFALTALFTVLVIEQYKKVRSLRSFLIAIVVGIGCMILVAPHYVLLASIVSGTIILLLVRKKD
jgi:4-azaleucine resistance transporter AzlC